MRWGVLSCEIWHESFIHTGGSNSKAFYLQKHKIDYKACWILRIKTSNKSKS